MRRDEMYSFGAKRSVHGSNPVVAPRGTRGGDDDDDGMR
jgi:hypothetical protein